MLLQQTPPAPIDIFGVAEQLTPLNRAADSNSTNRVFVGTVVLPGGQLRKSAYVKIFPTQLRPQLVYNEVIAFHLAAQFGVPAPLTFPCLCRASLFAPITLEEFSASSSVGPRERSTEFLLGVASLQVDQVRIQTTLRHSHAVWADLIRWPSIATLAVYDELIGNDDRHISNLIRCGRHQYCVIDNERMLFGEQWFSAELDELTRRRCDPNKIANSISESTDDLLQRRMIAIAEKHARETRLEVPHVSSALESICRTPNATTMRLINMLNRRRMLLPHLMQWHKQKGELFKRA